jgi:hypothetical protein
MRRQVESMVSVTTKEKRRVLLLLLFRPVRKELNRVQSRQQQREAAAAESRGAIHLCLGIILNSDSKRDS